jgi:hypothetical protein
MIANYNRDLPKLSYFQIAETKFISDSPKRKYRLKKALLDAGLSFSSSNQLCDKYIKTEEPYIQDIVRRTGEVKYLYDYCNLREELKKANLMRDKYFIYDISVFKIAENSILDRIGKYPTRFPWDKRVEISNYDSNPDSDFDSDIEFDDDLKFINNDYNIVL